MKWSQESESRTIYSERKWNMECINKPKVSESENTAKKEFDGQRPLKPKDKKREILQNLLNSWKIKSWCLFDYSAKKKYYFNFALKAECNVCMKNKLRRRYACVRDAWKYKKTESSSHFRIAYLFYFCSRYLLLICVAVLFRVKIEKKKFFTLRTWNIRLWWSQCFIK